MGNCEIFDAQLSAGVTQEPGAEVKLTAVVFNRCVSGVEVQTLPKSALPRIDDCNFKVDQKYHVIVKQTGIRYGQRTSEVEQIVYQQKSGQEKESEEPKAAQQSSVEQPSADDQQAGG